MYLFLLTLKMAKLQTNINYVKLVLSLNIDHYQATKPSTIHVHQAWQNHKTTPAYPKSSAKPFEKNSNIYGSKYNIDHE
jgi:hypothetical protein